MRGSAMRDSLFASTTARMSPKQFWGLSAELSNEQNVDGILAYMWLILKRVVQDFRGTVTLENFFLLLLFFLHIGLAQFSGSVIRRPNVSIYMSLAMALICYKTTACPLRKERLP